MSEAGTGPAGNSTTNDAVPGKAWFCQFDAVPYGQGTDRYGSTPPSSAANRRAVARDGPQARTTSSCWWKKTVTAGCSARTSAAKYRDSGSDSGRGPDHWSDPRRPIRAQFAGKFRFRSTPFAFCRVPSARQPSGFRAGRATISVPGSAAARCNARTIGPPAGSLPWMQPTTRSCAGPCPSTTGRITRPWTLWPSGSGSAASNAARKRTVGILQHMKRLSVFVLAAALLAGCGGSSKSSRSSTSSTASGGSEKAYVVLITDVGQLNDHGFNQLAYEGLKRAQKNLGVRGDVFQSPSSADYVPNLATAARKGADLVISVGFDQANSIAKVAKQFPKTHF